MASSRGLRRKARSETALNATLRAIHGLPEKMEIHDLRRTCRIGLSDLGGTQTPWLSSA